jgi:hypothetical protein
MARVTRNGVCRAIMTGAGNDGEKHWLRAAQDCGCLNAIDVYKS